MDETYFGGRFKSGKGNKKQKQAIQAKSAIIGAIERKGKIKVEKTNNIKSETIGNFLQKNIDPDGTTLLTDESNRYE